MDEAVELAELRRRAYGPAGGIDAAGIARLTYLEGRVRAAAEEEVVVAPPEVITAQAVPSSPAPTIPAPPASIVAPAAPESRAAARATPRRWPLILGALVVGAIAGAALTQVIGEATGPHPDAVLPIVAEKRPIPDGVPPDAASHAMYRSLDVRSWTDEVAGFRCIGVLPRGAEADGAFPQLACGQAAFPTYLDATVVEAEMDPLYPFQKKYIDDAVIGEMLRFELIGDEVRVWRVVPPEIEG